MPVAHHFDVLGSTQDKAFELLELAGADSHLVTCDRQSHGRGREGRSWAFEAGKSIAFSYAFSKNACRVEGLSLVVGLSLLRALHVRDLQIKWPNDLMLHDEKVGGILVEMKSNGSRSDIVIGVGINMKDVEGYRGLGQNIDVSRLVECLEEDLSLFFKQGFRAFKSLYEEHLWRRGDSIVTTLRGVKREVIVKGTSETGTLIVESEGAREEISSGEIFL